MKKKIGFTLAEVLITLTIIGVIAAITVPALIQRTNKQEYVTALQKAYSTLSQAANMIIAENGSPKCDDGGWACSEKDIYNMFKKYLSSAKECGTAKGCFEQYAGRAKGPKWLNNGEDNNYNNWAHNSFVLADGTEVTLYHWGDNFKKCGMAYYDSPNSCMYFLADINGAGKPNQWGRDTFMFALKETGIHPAGCGTGSGCIKNDGTFDSGWGCACKVLSEGAMNY